MKRYLYLIVAVFMATVLAACHDDEPEIQTPDDAEDEVTRIEFPTEDVITATYAGNYAVIGPDNYDEATRYVIKRLSGTRYSYSPADDFIADDVRLVFLNNEALLSLEKPMVTQLKKVVENGGYIYVHKPNDFALVFLAVAVYDDIDDALAELRHGMPQSRCRADAEDAMEYDTYIMGPANRQLCLLDIYDGESTTIDVFDPETGEIKSEVYQPEMPSAYAYGRFAENIIEWMNENIEQSRASIFTRAGEDMLDNASEAHCRALEPNHKGRSHTYLHVQSS